MEANEAETTASTGPSEAALRKAQFELYKKDRQEVKKVRAQILGLNEGEEATQEDFDSSPDFQLRWAVNKTHPPTVIGEHWINHLDSEGRIAKCKPHDFKFEDEWLPLYTRAFPGLLEGLLGRLGIAAPGESNPPASSQEGAGHLWSSAVCEAISQIEQKEVGIPGTVGLPQCLDLRYEEDFLEKQSHQIPAVFSDLLFIPSMANVVYKVVKPPVVLKALPSASGRKVPSVSSQPEDGGPEPEVSEPKESASSTPKTSQQVQEQVTEASNTDSDKADEPTTEEEQPP